MTVQLSIDELQKFYLEAASATYAGNVASSTIDELRGSNVYRWQRVIPDGLEYIDIYFVNGEDTFGMTIIQYLGQTVWAMSYDGWCEGNDVHVLAFLKQALLSTYAQGEFHCGRGPSIYLNGNFTWVYEMKPQNAARSYFELFEGEERIYRDTHMQKPLFFHHVRGGIVGKIS